MEERRKGEEKQKEKEFEEDEENGGLEREIEERMER